MKRGMRRIVPVGVIAGLLALLYWLGPDLGFWPGGEGDGEGKAPSPTQPAEGPEGEDQSSKESQKPMPPDQKPADVVKIDGPDPTKVFAIEVRGAVIQIGGKPVTAQAAADQAKGATLPVVIIWHADATTAAENELKAALNQRMVNYTDWTGK